jgi:predicted kinase
LRGNETDRSISEEQIRKALQSVPHNVSKITPNVDKVFVIRNDDSPRLEGCKWSEFAKTFTQIPLSGKLALGERMDMSGTVFRRKSCRRRFSVFQSSEDNHKADHKMFYGKYAHIRKTLDYNYHKNYTFERQRFQDAIVSEYVNNAILSDNNGELCTTPTEPWIVFTAGAMGAGKSYTMRRLVEKGRFPLIAFVSVDPDDIRRHLPEFHLYVDQSPELAGELTRKESGYIAEILTLASLREGKNVLVDGSLRDWSWYKSYFERLRNEFPALRIAILHITAPRDAVFQRAAVSDDCFECFSGTGMQYTFSLLYLLLGSCCNNRAYCSSRTFGCSLGTGPEICRNSEPVSRLQFRIKKCSARRRY